MPRDAGQSDSAVAEQKNILNVFFTFPIPKLFVSLHRQTKIVPLTKNVITNKKSMGSPIVTLTTDWGYSDYYIGRVKGKLYSYIPGVQVVDITHGIPPYQITRATYVVKYGCLGFPPGTIHIIDVCSSQTPEQPFIVVEHNEQYYICTDNGLPAAVFGTDGVKAAIIDKVNQETDSYTFAACDLFCKVAAMLDRRKRG